MPRSLEPTMMKTTAPACIPTTRKFLVEVRFNQSATECYATERYEIAADNEDYAVVRAAHMAQESNYATARIVRNIQAEVLRELDAGPVEVNHD